MKRTSLSKFLVLTIWPSVAAGLLLPRVGHTANGAWNVDAGGLWSTASNWSPAAAPGSATGDVISLTYNIGGTRTVTNDLSGRLVGTLNIGDPTAPFFAYTLASNGGSFSFNNGGLGASLVQSGTTASDVISLAIGLADNLAVNNVTNLTLSGAISGAGKSITKSGAGNLTLSGNNSFSGGLTLGAGRLTLVSPTALGASAGRFTISAGVLDTVTPNLVNANNNPMVFDSDFTFVGSQNLHLGTGAASLGATAGSRTVTVSANILTLGGGLSNGVATALTKAGAGTLNLGGANTYTGGTAVNAGILTYLTTAAKPASGTTTVASGATLGLGVGGAGTFSSADLDALVANTLAGVSLNASARIGADTSAGTFTYGSSITGSRGFTKLGTNALVLTAANAHTGVTTINGGALQLDHATALPGGTGATGGTSALTFNGGVLALGAGDFTRSLGSAGTATAVNFTGHGGWAANGADRVVNLGGNATPSTITWGNANSGFNNKYLLLGTPTATHTVELQNSLDLGTSTRTILVSDGAAAVDAVLSGTLTGSAGGNMNIVGGGTVAFEGASRYIGNTTVNSNSTLLVSGSGSISCSNVLFVGANGSLGTCTYSSEAASTFGLMTIGQTANAHGTLNQSAGAITVTGVVTLASSNAGYGTYNLSGGTLTATTISVGWRGPLAGTFNLSGSGALSANSMQVADFSSGAPSVGQFTMSGGTATLGALVVAKSSSDNTHSGTVDFNGGTLTVGSVAGGTASGSSTDTSTFNFNGGTLKPSASSAAFFRNLTTATVKDGGALFHTSGFDVTVAQSLLHAAGATNAPLVKNGGGTLTLTGTNTFAGPVTVNSGTLVLTGPNSFTRPITLLGTLTVGGAAQLSLGSSSVAITNDGALAWGSSADQTLSGVISGTGSLTKSGAGALTLSAANTCAGTTAVNAGRLIGVSGGSLDESDVSVASGAGVGVRVTSSGGQWSCKSLALAAGATQADFFFYGAVPGATAPLLVRGDFINEGTLSVTLTGAGLETGTYPLIQSLAGFTAGTMGTATLPGGAVGHLEANETTSTIDLVVTTASTPLVWDGASGAWDIGTSPNWAGGLTYAEGDLVRFDDTSSGASSLTVTVATTVSPSGVTVANAAKDYTFAGPGALAGPAALAKSGVGTLTLAAPNTYSGGTTLGADAGTVRAAISAAGSGLGSGPVAIGDHSAVVLDNANVSGSPVALANAVSGLGALQLSFATNATARSTVLSGLAGFAGSLHVGAADSPTGDKLDASGAEAPSASVTVADGHTLLVGNGATAASFGGITLRGAGNAEGRGALRLGANTVSLTAPVTLQGDATIASDIAGATLNGTITGSAAAGATNVLTQGASSSAAGCVFAGALNDGLSGGRLALLQNKGVLTLSAVSSHSGGTLVQGSSTLAIGVDDALPVTGSLVLGGTNGSGGLTLAAHSQTLPGLLTAGTSASWLNTVTVGAGQTLAITGASGLTIGVDPGAASTHFTRMTGAGALVVDNASAYVVIGRGATNQNYSNTSTLDLSGLSDVTLGSAETGVREVRLGYGMTASGTLTNSNVRNRMTATAVYVGNSVGGNNPGTGGPGGVAGTLILGAGENTFAVDSLNVAFSKASGTVRFVSPAPGAGTVVIGGRTRATAEIALGNKTATATGNTPVGTLDLRGHAATVAAGTVTLGKEDNAQTWNAGAVPPTNYLSGATGNLYFDAGTFSATNVNMAAKTGYSLGAATATLTVSGGVFTVTEGGLFTLGSQSGWGTSSASLNVLGGTFACHADIRSGPTNCAGTINLDGGTLDMSGRAIGTGVQTVRVFNARSGTLQNLGQFNNGAPLVKSGAGTLTLAGTNTYSGATVVNTGVLRLTGGACLPPTAELYLVDGASAQLDYDGSLMISKLYVNGVRKMGGLYSESDLSPYLSGTGFLAMPSQGTVLQLR